ncbi:hypothetical protein C6988_00140 [Nitrosopumilus sp. b1]|uniref:hypothetical protein n=1 Tax=Nitrosopumilus sp. b1 TaxID=2109907 RepID=UPI0015F3EB46|nr:hypothetical protein [Nitrosopumilus sp. b1]KAF6244038.1 hypothetical protein C6988_00140 [Nitrosopumilus sp. b1]
MKILISGIIAVVIGLIVILAYSFPAEDEAIKLNPLTIQYSSLNFELQKLLSENQLQMSNPIKISTPESILKYCNFFADSKIDAIEHCTSTEIKDSNGNFLGNIHMIGTNQQVDSIIIIAQSDSSMNNLDSIDSLFDSSIKVLVCDCWEEKSPGDFTSVSDWISATANMKNESKVIKSNIDSLESKDLYLELSENEDGYLWTLVISLIAT